MKSSCRGRMTGQDAVARAGIHRQVASRRRDDEAGRRRARRAGTLDQPGEGQTVKFVASARSTTRSNVLPERIAQRILGMGEVLSLIETCRNVPVGGRVSS